MRRSGSHFAMAVLVVAIVGSGSAQQPPQQQQQDKAAFSACDRSVDEYLADLEHSKNKKQNRNRNPLPNNVCVFGWCQGGVGRKTDPPKDPGSSRSETEPSDPSPTAAPPGESSSKRPAAEIGVPSENTAAAECDPQQAAQDVEVGDYYFSQKSYKPALNRYRLALENKPNDPAIHLRLARTYEKLKDSDNAVSNYRSVIDRSDPQSPRATEAQAAIARLNAPAKK